MLDTSAINLRILQQGAIVVDEARAHRSAAGIVCFYLSLGSKYAERPMVDHQAGRPPRLHISAGPQTLKAHIGVPRDLDTIIEFTDYVGWEVFSCSDPARYTVALTLVAPEGSAEACPAQRAVGIWPLDEAAHSVAIGMSTFMRVQGSSLRPMEIGQAVVASEPAPKPCCGCKKA